jgi:hypothetical protein
MFAIFCPEAIEIQKRYYYDRIEGYDKKVYNNR